MKMTRRELLKAGAAFGVFNIVPSSVLSGETAPSNQLTRALIGFGAIARSANHLPFRGSRLVGLCDPFDYRVKEGLAAAEKSGWGKIKAYGENIAVGQRTADKVMAAWMTSSGHRANILRPSYGSIGVCAVTSNGVTYWVQLFGR